MEERVTREVLSIRSLELRRGERVVLKDVNLAVNEGQLVALMGLSGGGKSTILRAVTALDPFQAGEIDVAGFPLRPGMSRRERDLAELRKRVGLVFQLHGLFEHLPARENVVLAPVHVLKTPRRDAERRAEELLASLGLSHRLSALPRELSGGEAQRVAIARALAMNPPLLLMDEPTASLDPARRNELGRTLVELTKSGRALVVATHDVDFVRDFASRVVILAAGEVVETGDPREVLTNPAHEATRQLLQTAPKEKEKKS